MFSKRQPRPPSMDAGSIDQDSEHAKTLAPAAENASKLLRDEGSSPAAASKAAMMKEAPPLPQGWGWIPIVMKLTAWMMHAMIDGMLLSSSTTVPTLVFTALAVSLCAVQDVAAFTVSMAKTGCTRNQMLLAVATFSLCFPLGAVFSFEMIAVSGSDSALLVVRVIIAGIFVYMAAFELAPPHSHSRGVNALYAVTFAVGACSVLSVELIEQASS